jgi:hypothetical protein
MSANRTCESKEEQAIVPELIGSFHPQIRRKCKCLAVVIGAVNSAVIGKTTEDGKRLRQRMRRVFQEIICFRVRSLGLIP